MDRPNLVVDIGTYETSVALVTGGRVRLVPCPASGAARWPSCAAVDGDRVVVGAAARRVPDGRYVDAVRAVVDGGGDGRALLAHYLAAVREEADRQAGAAVDRLTLAIPTGYGPSDPRRAAVRDAAGDSGFPDAELVGDAVAAVEDVRVFADLPDGALVLVCDLGLQWTVTLARVDPGGATPLGTDAGGRVRPAARGRRPGRTGGRRPARAGAGPAGQAPARRDRRGHRLARAGRAAVPADPGRARALRRAGAAVAAGKRPRGRRPRRSRPRRRRRGGAGRRRGPAARRGADPARAPRPAGRDPRRTGAVGDPRRGPVVGARRRADGAGRDAGMAPGAGPVGRAGRRAGDGPVAGRGGRAVPCRRRARPGPYARGTGGRPDRGPRRRARGAPAAARRRGGPGDGGGGGPAGVPGRRSGAGAPAPRVRASCSRRTAGCSPSGPARARR